MSSVTATKMSRSIRMTTGPGKSFVKKTFSTSSQEPKTMFKAQRLHLYISLLRVENNFSPQLLLVTKNICFNFFHQLNI